MIRRVTIGVLASLALAMSAAAAISPPGLWKFARSKDAMNDQVDCSLTSPSRHIRRLKLDNGLIYLVTDHVIAADDEGSVLTARVDENKAMDLDVRTVSGQLGAVEDANEVGSLIREMENGKVILLRILTTGTHLETDVIPLGSFRSGLERFRKCVAAEARP